MVTLLRISSKTEMFTTLNYFMLFYSIVLNALNIALCSVESNAFSLSKDPMQNGILNSLHFSIT